MRGLVLQDGAAVVRDDLPEPGPRAGWSRVAVLTTGVCATDLALSRGYMGFAGVPGHEFVGRALDGPLAGQRVVGEINAGCGVCATCRAGDSRHCGARTVLGIAGLSGAFAEQLLLPDANLLAVPDEVSSDAASFVEPLAAALAITEQVAVDRHTRALVAGDGRLGLLCALALHRAGAQVTVAGRHPERGALLPADVPLVTGLLEAAGGAAAERVDLAVEATGNPDVLGRLCAHVRPRGTLVLKTTSEQPARLDLAPIVVDELRLLGSRCGRFEPALAWLAENPPPVEAMVSARFGLDQAAAALARAGDRDVLKVLVDVAPR